MSRISRATALDIAEKAAGRELEKARKERPLHNPGFKLSDYEISVRETTSSEGKAVFDFYYRYAPDPGLWEGHPLRFHIQVTQYGGHAEVIRVE